MAKSAKVGITTGSNEGLDEDSSRINNSRINKDESEVPAISSNSWKQDLVIP